MKKILTLVLLIALSISTNAQNKHELRIVKGKIDTVYSANLTFKGVTTPGATLSVNGESFKVYKTGCFGRMEKLKLGENNFKVVSTLKGSVLEESFSVFYTDQAAPQPMLKIIPIKDSTYYVKTLPEAFLLYGTSDDRLGGAKMNFIDEGIVLKVVQKYGELLKVQLSENRYAHIPESVTEPTQETTIEGTTLNWRVKNIGDYDRVSIGLPAKQAYIVRGEIDPNTIIVDIFGAQCNSNWIIQELNLGIIEYVDFEQVEYDVFRAKIRLNSKYAWGYTVNYTDNILNINVKHAPKPTLKGMVIAVDAGHGGPSSSGAVSTSGIMEKVVNLDLALTMKKMLEAKGAKVVLTRLGDEEVYLGERINIARRANADMLISIHNNATGGNQFTVKGASTYYRHIQSRELAKSILVRMTEIDGVENFGLVGNFNFKLNSPTDFPSVLIEAQFMSHFEDEERIADPKFRKELMKKAVQGIEDYVKHSK